MPGGDRTGPMGNGPRTGRGAGFCSGFSQPGYANMIDARGAGWGRGRGFGRGFAGGGRGWRNWFYATGQTRNQRAVLETQNAAPQEQTEPALHEQEIQQLKNQSQELQETLHAINHRITELEARSNT